MGTDIKSYILKIKQLLCLEQAVRHGSISKAALGNGMKQTNMSKQLTDLDSQLPEKLLTRLSNGVKLTEIGYHYYAAACDIKSIMQKVQNLNNKKINISGSIRLWISDGLGIGVLSKCFAEFYRQYPDVAIEITCSLEMPKLDEFDMAVLFQKPTVKALSIQKECVLKFALFASKEYLAKYGMPKNIEDLCSNHKICDRSNYGSYSKKWAGIVSKAKAITSVKNSSAMLVHLIKDGLGVGLLPRGTAMQEENLVEIKNISLNFKMKYWIVIQKDAETRLKIKALTNIIENESAKL